MSSPFPGRDPYLERTDLWQGFHNTFITYARDALQPQLPDHYVAVLEGRVYRDRPANGGSMTQRVPDLQLLRTAPADPGATREAGAMATATRGHWIPVEPVEVREAYLTIRTLPDRELVTTVELLSPSNKRPGEGRDQYLARQQELLERRINLVEIELLRAGAHTVAVPAACLTHLAPFHYLACVFRRARPRGFEVFPWSVRQPLPTLAIPLPPDDPEVKLDLPAVFTETYDRGVFRQLLDYAGEPDPPLAGDDVPWARGLLQQAGLRGGSRA